MASRFCTTWVVTPTTPPQAMRHCAGCGTRRAFACSGRVRLNANGKRLDAWLIYRCVHCAQTWNRTLFERTAIGDLTQADLRALQHSDPTWVRPRANDAAALRRQCDALMFSPDVRITKAAHHTIQPDWDVVDLHLRAPCPTGLRLDRLLAAQLGLSRSRLKGLVGFGSDPGKGKGRALNRPLTGDVSLCLERGPLTDREAAAVVRGLID